MKKTKLNIKSILRRPLVKIVLIVMIVVLIVITIRSIVGKKSNSSTDLIGYQKLISVKDGTFYFVNQEGKVEKYKDYTTMDDFYYDTTCVSRINKDTGVTEMALINTNERQIVKFGKYSSYNQIGTGKYYKISSDGKYGIINNEGKVVIEPEYDYIVITSVQDASELVFECQKDGKYIFFNEAGKSFYETDVNSHSVQYCNKFNSDYDTIVIVKENDEKKFFNLATGDRMFEEYSNPEVSYNIVKADGKIYFYNKKGKIEKELDVSSDYSVTTKVYYKKYVLVEERNNQSGTKQTKYTIYDSNFKKVIEEESKIYPIQDVNEDVYFVVNDVERVRIISANGKTTKIDGYEYIGNSASNVQNIVLNPLGDISRFEVFTLGGKSVLKDVKEYTEKGAALIVTRIVDESKEEKTLLLGKNKIELVPEDSIVDTGDYIIVENFNEGYTTVLTRDGKKLIDKAEGRREFYTDKYIAIKNGDSITIYDTTKGKEKYTFATSDYSSKEEEVKVVEMKDAYYSFEGKKLIEK